MKAYTCAEAAAILGLCGTRVRQLCKGGSLKARKHGWAWVIEEGEIERFNALRMIKCSKKIEGLK